MKSTNIHTAQTNPSIRKKIPASGKSPAIQIKAIKNENPKIICQIAEDFFPT